MSKKVPGGGRRQPEGFLVDWGEAGEVRITIPPRPPPPESPDEDAMLRPPNPRARLYPPPVVAVLRILCRETRWITADAIAQELKLPKDRLVDVILRELGEDGCRLVESRPGPSGGYMLAIPDAVTAEEYRRRFGEWLDAVEKVGE